MSKTTQQTTGGLHASCPFPQAELDLGARAPRLTGCNDVVHYQDSLAWFYGIGLHLEFVDAIFLCVFCGDAIARELALLTDGHEAGTQPESEAWPEEEPSSVQAYHDVWSTRATVGGIDKGGQSVDELSMGVVGAEQRADVFENDAGRGKVGKLTKGLL